MSEPDELKCDRQPAPSPAEDFDAEIKRMMRLATAITADTVTAQSWFATGHFEALHRVVVVESIYLEKPDADTW